MSDSPLHLFEGYGIELEYMIVRQKDLSVFPVSDQILHAIAGEYLEEVECGEISWSNELVLHVIELKTNGPAEKLDGLHFSFHKSIQDINALLLPLQGKLLPTAMHPWMNPLVETKLWPHHYNHIYTAYNRIFNCTGHGWSNLQSVHINLPFANDEEFGRLHAAIRLVLPIIPALTASSPLMESQKTSFLDTRLEVYRKNQKKVPMIAGRVIPEPVFSIQEYHEQILHQIYQAIAPHDIDHILQKEWLNSRGAIARFDRNAIEIRIIDIQECPLADIALCTLITKTVQALVEERWCSYAQQKQWSIDALEPTFLQSLKDAEKTPLHNPDYLKLFGYPSPSCTLKDLWTHLLSTLGKDDSFLQTHYLKPLQLILEKGPLARRISNALNPAFSPQELSAVYEKLSQCLAQNTLFTGIT